MNPEMPQPPHDELESSLTALLLGELPHDQAATLHQKLAQDAELAKLYERLKQTINLVRETISSPAAQTADQPTPLKLSDERRQKLLQQFKTVAPKEFARPRRRAMPWLVPVGIAAALVALLAATLLPALSKAKSRSMRYSFGTLSLSKSAAPAPAVVNQDASSLEEVRDALVRSKSSAVDKSLPQRTAEAMPPAEVPASAKSSGTSIVLPKATGSADAASTPAVTEVGKPWSTTATLNGFYDDSSARAGGVGVSGTLGNSGGKAVNTVGITEGRQPEFAAANSPLGQPESFSTLQPSKPKAAGDLAELEAKLGEVQFAGDKAQGLNKSKLQDPSKNWAFVDRNPNASSVEFLAQAAAPTTVLPPTATAPPEDRLGKPSRSYGFSLLGPKDSLTTDAKNEGELRLGTDVARSDDANKLTDTTTSRIRLQGLTTTPDAKRSLIKAPIVPATPLAGPVTAQEQESKQALTLGLRPNPSGSSYGEGAYGGYAAIQQAPSLGGRGEAQERSVLRSPKEGGVAGANRGTAITPALPAPQDTTVKALGFDWYLGNQVANDGRIAAQGGAAPTGHSPGSLGTPDFGVAAAGSETLNYQLRPNASAQAGLANSDGDKVPMLADVPLAGRLFRSPPEVSASGVNANVADLAFGKERSSGVGLADQEALELEKNKRESEKADKPNLGPNIYSLNVVGYTDVKLPITATNSVAFLPAEPSRAEGYTQNRQLSQLGTAADGASRAARSPIVLPPAQGETRLALNESSGADQKVREAQKKVDDLRANLSISDGIADGGQSPLMTADTLRRLERMRVESKAEYDREQSLVDRLKIVGKEQGPEALAQAIPTSAPDSQLSSLLEQLTVAEQRRVALENEHGPTHPEVLKSKAMADDLHAKIKGRVDGIMLGLEARVTSEKASLQNFERELAMAATNDVEQADRTRPYFEAKRKLEELQRARQILEKSEATKASLTNQPDVAPPKPATPAPVPQPEVQTADNAFSTFSLNVSDVSFKLAAVSLEKGVMPEPATVRSEEFINAFDYRDPEPPPGVPVAFAWERAQYPFAQNRDLLRFSIKTAALGRQPGRPLNLVLLLDNSGSMERADRVSIIREALRVLAEQLQPQDILSVITFARTSHLFADGAPGSDAGAIAMALTELTPEGGTNLEDAMNLAYQTALRHYLANGVNRVVLLTDGAANLGDVDPEALKQKVEANRKQGIALDCFGIGWEGYNDDLLEVLSRNGDGRYGFVNTPEEAATEFAGQLAGALHVAVSDVKVQVEFNPARVTAYRQIGYAKHQLTKEQFRDNTVDAAEIGAAESGNALYAIEVNPGGDGPLATVRVRYKIPGTTDYHEHEWPVPYTGNAVALEQASPAMRLAATASAFSEWLVSSPYAGEVSPDRLLGYLSGVPEVYGADARPKKLEWMVRQAKSIAGK
jgi:Mg-chelatase subunit ChlD